MNGPTRPERDWKKPLCLSVIKVRDALARMVLDRLLASADQAREPEPMVVDSYQEEGAAALVDLDPPDHRAFVEECAVSRDLRC